MGGQPQPGHVNFSIPVVIPPELAQVAEDLIALKNTLREEIEFYRARGAKNLFSEREAAEFFGISLKSLREERLAGKISYSPIKGRFFYTRKNLEDYVERLQISAKAKKDK